ncbi:hypothetical protein COLO4_16525 [Corchorus olitorius]|uniref:Uncharacterized protein n=1 Tax=Corchorus olitorius TaxID=93759 RepID=A0A1R3JH05_9ROSI|nr:hypothetical protein COLO4_16525 [Corchorus olitorius]
MCSIFNSGSVGFLGYFLLWLKDGRGWFRGNCTGGCLSLFCVLVGCWSSSQWLKTCTSAVLSSTSTTPCAAFLPQKEWCRSLFAVAVYMEHSGPRGHQTQTSSQAPFQL